MRMRRILVAVATACAVVTGSLYLLGQAAATSAAAEPAGPRSDLLWPVEAPATVTYTTYLPIVAREFVQQLHPNDPRYVAGQQWGLGKVHAPGAWYSSRGDGVVIAIIDSGIDLTHPDLAPVLWTNPGEIAGNGIVAVAASDESQLAIGAAG